MFYSDSAKVVFVAIPKTGTRTIYDTLKTQYGGQMYKEHHPIIPANMKSYFSFCTVRNPYDRAASCWWSTSRRNLDKRRFVADAAAKGWDNTLTNFLRIVKQRGAMGTRLTRPQISFMKENRIDALLRFDHLEEDFNKLPFVKTPIELPTLNPTKLQTGPNPTARPPWEELVDEEAVSLINEMYAEDFEASNCKMIKDFSSWNNE